MCLPIEPENLVYKRLTASGVVCPKPCWLYKYRVSANPFYRDVKPSGFIDIYTDWTDEEKAYDVSTLSYAYTSIGALAWSSTLLYSHTGNLCICGMKIKTWSDSGGITSMRVRLRKTGEDDTVFVGAPPTDGYKILEFDTAKRFDNLEVKFQGGFIGAPFEPRIYDITYKAVNQGLVVLYNGFTKADERIADIISGVKLSGNIVFRHPVSFNKSLYAHFQLQTDYAEFLYLPVS